ncbi:DHA2 family efflux MFS transporter permease subunit [Aquisalimonas sp.]|uniref:DHA2 family efflux MFS transporter permease subunit n=1 Tax=Aquisalimonas sp. TaxID=1872621 RepID=UPI0025BE703E|nr:DHA2 family efflux MFS transporter permease subunit [Aquisalimonas sp.]
MEQEVERLFARYGAGYKWMALVTVMLGTLSTAVATTVVNVAIPDVMHDFDVGQREAHWLSTGFLAAMTTAILLNAWALQRFGMRRVYVFGLLVFVLASLLGVWAAALELVILARVLQGLVAGVLQPLAITLIYQVFPQRQRGLGIGLFGLGVILGPAIGPALGGVLVDAVGWRAVMALPVPTAVLGGALAVFLVPVRRGAGRRVQLDWLSVLMLGLAVTGLLWSMVSGQRLGWTSWPVLPTLIAVLGLSLGFVARQLLAREPLLDPRLYQAPAFAAGSTIALLFGAGLFGSTYLIPLFVQEIQELSPTAAGLVLMPAGLVMAAAFPLGGHLADRVRTVVPIAAGLVIMALSCLALGFAGPQTGVLAVTAWVALGRVGLGLGMPAIQTGSLYRLPLSRTAQGAGALQFSQQLGGAIGVTSLAVLLEWRALREARRLLPDDPVTKEALLTSIPPELYREAYTVGFQWSFLVLGLVFVLALAAAGRFAKY